MSERARRVHLAGSVDLGRFVLDIDLRADPGDVVALVGPNGSGKSTALQTLAGLRRVRSGRVEIGGVVVDEPAARQWVPAHRRRIGYLFQSLELFPHLNVLDNVAYGLRRQGLNRREAREQAVAWLQAAGVEHLAAARPVTLSGGQAQRVAMARALAVDPDLLLLDEPMSALDAESRLTIRSDLRRRLDAFDGVAVLVTHDLLDVVALANRVVVLDDGQVIQTTTPDGLRSHPRTRHAAALVGRNLVRGMRTNGVVRLADGVDVPAAAGPDGPVDVICSPSAVQILPRHAARPDDSWASTVAGIEAVGDHAKAVLAAPVPLSARVGLDLVADGLRLDSHVWVRLDPAELTVLTV